MKVLGYKENGGPGSQVLGTPEKGMEKEKLLLERRKKNELVHSPINKMTKGENRNWKKRKNSCENLYIFALLKDII